MSVPTATPSPMPNPVESPNLDASAKSPIRLFRFASDILDLVVDVVAPGSPAREALKQGVDALFSDHWQVMTWSDLKVFTSGDVATALRPGTGVPSELSAPVIVRKLGYVVDYAQFGTLSLATTMDDIVSSVKHRAALPIVPGSPARKTVQVFDKNTVPTLDKFSGRDEDYFTWKESTINVLGAAGLGRFLTDQETRLKHVSVGESVFYALRGAVHGGQAQSIAQGMLDDSRLDSVALWSGLEEYYDTALNRANVVLFDIRRLLSLRLTPDTTATKFISDFRDCLQRLRKNNARISDDTDTLRALLLVAIQDDDFEIVRDSIVHKPDMGEDTILTELRERETSLMMKDQASHIGGDGGTSSSRYSRRVQQTQSPGTPGKSGETNASSSQKWNIPKYPDSWRSGFGASLFKLLLAWRNDAHKGRSQFHLSNEYATFVESFKQNSGKSKGGKHKLPSADSTSASSSSNGDDAATPGDRNGSDGARKRIRLQKSRRIITERSA
jgi:hypothetical protein